MTHTKTLLKKAISAALVGTFAFSPVVMNMSTAQAAPSLWAQNKNDHDRKGYETFTGTVNKVDSDTRFDLSSNGKTYNVNMASRLPRRLGRGDVVRVVGRRSGVNDIDNARVEIIRNTPNNSGNRYETFNGTVIKIDNDRRFDIRIDGKTYNVNTVNRLPRNLNRGDNVRVTGQRSGVNDISNASVEVRKR